MNHPFTHRWQSRQMVKRPALREFALVAHQLTEFVDMKWILLSLFCCLIVGCSTTARLYPHSGPMSQIKPLPVIIARASGTAMGTHGKCTATMPDGERCVGEWSTLRGGIVSHSSSVVTGRTGGTVETSGAIGGARVRSSSLFDAYGSVFGWATSSMSDANWTVVAICTGPSGTVIEMELRSDNSGHGYGIAVDNHDNLYRVLF